MPETKVEISRDVAGWQDLTHLIADHQERDWIFRGAVSNHKADVLLLKDVVAGDDSRGRIVAPAELPMSTDDKIQSAFAVWGLDTGVPPVIMGGS